VSPEPQIPGAGHPRDDVDRPERGGAPTMLPINRPDRSRWMCRRCAGVTGCLRCNWRRRKTRSSSNMRQKRAAVTRDLSPPVAEKSPRPTRQRERRMQWFKSAGQAPRVLAAQGPLAPHVRPRRHLLPALISRQEMRPRVHPWPGMHERRDRRRRDVPQARMPPSAGQSRRQALS
jgi:hypothetical protein